MRTNKYQIFRALICPQVRSHPASVLPSTGGRYSLGSITVRAAHSPIRVQCTRFCNSRCTASDAPFLAEAPHRKGTQSPKELCPSGLTPHFPCTFKCLIQLGLLIHLIQREKYLSPEVICSYTHTNRSIYSSSVGFC